MRAKFINEDGYILETLIRDFETLRESNDNKSIIQKIKSAVSKGVKISIIVTALLSAGYTPTQAHGQIQSAGIELSVSKLNNLVGKSSLEKNIKKIEKAGYSGDIFQNRGAKENLKDKEIAEKTFVGKTKSAIKLHKNQFLRENSINSRNVMEFTKVINGQVHMIILYGK